MKALQSEGFYLLLLYFYSIHHTVGSTDGTITMTQFLKDGDNIASRGGSFEMGFFSPGNSKLRHVGMWYKNISVRTVVWVANREAPLTGRSGMKLGWNFVTGREVYLSSWQNKEDPAPGDFTYHCDPSGYPQNILNKGSNVVYRSGPWNGRFFSGATSSRESFLYIWDILNAGLEVTVYRIGSLTSLYTQTTVMFTNCVAHTVAATVKILL
ncbi:hypothetical protein HAX54_048204, partial [Datura stramonium]|nr:hypothetical protein [Datura stramonium]